MRTKYYFVAGAIMLVLVAMIVFSAGAGLSAFGLGSGAVLAANPGLVDLDREYFKEILGTYGKASSPQPSYLRVEQTLSNTKNRYVFDLKKTGTETATERKLDRNDIFVITHIGVYLIAQVSTTIGLSRLQTYVNPDVFVSATGFTPNHLNVLYSGWLEIKVGTKVNAEAIDMNKFHFVPDTQQDVTNGFDYPGFDIENMSYWPGSLFHLKGTMNIDIHIECPSITGLAWAAVAANTSNKIVFYPMGYLLKNAAA